MNMAKFESLTRDARMFEIIKAINPLIPITAIRFNNLTDAQQLFILYRAILTSSIPANVEQLILQLAPEIASNVIGEQVPSVVAAATSAWADANIPGLVAAEVAGLSATYEGNSQITESVNIPAVINHLIGNDIDGAYSFLITAMSVDEFQASVRAHFQRRVVLDGNGIVETQTIGSDIAFNAIDPNIGVSMVGNFLRVTLVGGDMLSESAIRWIVKVELTLNSPAI